MIIDCHVHVAALTAVHGKTSDKQLDSIPFRFMRQRLGIVGRDEQTERQIENRLVQCLEQTPELDAAVVLALDQVYTPAGEADPDRTHLFVTNDYVIELCKRHPRMRFGASINPYRTDAVAELRRCAAAGAVLVKWLPIVQGFNPADDRCLPFYDELARLKLPLLSHTGGERTLVRLNDEFSPPRLLEPALKRGVTVIAAHCGSRSSPFETDYIDEFIRMLEQYPNLYGDTAALCIPTRSHSFAKIFKSKLLMARLVHGSDWPVISLPPLRWLGVRKSIRVMKERNWLRRDVLIKREMGLPESYFHRGAELLGLSTTTAAVPLKASSADDAAL